MLWWALSLGACLGGNGTMIGASANVVTVGMAEKAGYPISFMYYFKAAFIPMIITVIFAWGGCCLWKYRLQATGMDLLHMIYAEFSCKMKTNRG